MIVSHILYKVNDLEASMRYFRSLGFQVEYGSKEKPHNALIYFSDGPYIELLKKAPISGATQLLLRGLGQGKVADRFKHWERVEEGFFGLCLENDQTHFTLEKSILKQYQQTYFTTKSKRKDPFNRLLKWKLLFPHELKLPFLMTAFNINPKPNNFIHPNGTKRIEQVTFGTDEHLFPVIEALCNDNCLNLCIGKGVLRVSYTKV